MSKYIRYILITFSVFHATVVAASTITAEQFDKLLEQAQFIIATWHGVLAALIFGLAMFLYRRIIHNEESSKKDIQDLDRYARHEVRELNAGIRSSLEIVMGQSRAFDERADRILEDSRRLSDEITSIRERIVRLEQDKALKK